MRSAGSSSMTMSSSSSSALWIVTGRSNSAAMISIASSVSDCVIVTNSPRPIIVLMISAVETPSFSAYSLTVTPLGTVTGPVGRTTGFSSRTSRSPPPRPPRCGRSRGPRAACESMTTRRFLPCGTPRCGRARPAGAPPGGGGGAKRLPPEVGRGGRLSRAGRSPAAAAGAASSFFLGGSTGSGLMALGCAAAGSTGLASAAPLADVAGFFAAAAGFFFAGACFGLEPASARAAATSSTISR